MKIISALESAGRPPAGRPDDPGEHWLVGGGEMGKVIRAMDWRKTPLGPIGGWPQSLRTTAGLALASNFPISVAWGPRHVQIYNDGYWPICGGKHPQSMGQDFSECWASAWPVIGEAFERALAGETSYLEDQRMFLDRNGYLEETFFTFSFSPIRDETGGVGGLFHPVTETTSKMVGQRRTRCLRDLANRSVEARTVEEAFVFAAETLADALLDLPFALFYVRESDGQSFRLISHVGLAPGTLASPPTIRADDGGERGWPVAEVLRTARACAVDDVEARFGPLLCEPYREPIHKALVLPITPPGYEGALGILVAGVSSRLPLGEPYRSFYDLLAFTVMTSVANGRAYQEERKRAEALAEIDRVKTAFFSNVSHEFRTPLTLMLGPLEDELAEKNQPLPAERRRRLETAHRNAVRLLKLVNTLLDFSRTESGRMQARYEPTDLAVLTSDLASVFRSAIERGGLTLTVDCPPLPEPICVDRDMWEKIVLNLLSNAFKHTFEGGIRVELRFRGDHAELAVKDSGVGIPKIELGRLFERFHQVKGVRSRSHEGSGIGLALVEQLVHAHGGKAWVESEPGQGTAFFVTVKTGQAHLPAASLGSERPAGSSTTRAAAFSEEALHWLRNVPPSTPPLAPANEKSAAPGARSGPSRGPRPRLLLADDNADMRDYVRRLLADRYDVVAVADGAAALEAVKEGSFELVLTDVMMPRVDGFGVLGALRADAATRNIPVILLSARAGEEAAVEGLDAGADDYLVKPFSARELLARVRTHSMLARARREWAEELERANKELETFSYSVSHDLRAPLRAIDGFSKIVLTHHAHQLDAEGKSHLARVRAAAGRMGELIDDLLKLSRLTRGPLKLSTVDLTALAQTVLDDLRRRDPARRVVAEVEEGLAARADARLVTVVLENLLGNAWKFTGARPDARIEVGRTRAGDQPAFYVRDDGAGFDMAYANQLFQPFQRLHSQAEFEGTGVGLATVHRVIARHGGRIWAESKPGAGATFFFTLGDEE